MMMSRLLLLLIVLAGPLGLAHPAYADAFSDAVAGLGAEGFAAKEEAIKALGGSADPRSISVLRALLDGRLVTVPPDNKLVVEGDGKFLDALTGAAVDDPGKTADRVRVNNRLRGAIEAALARLTLLSPNPDDRIAAAQAALKNPDPAAVAGLEAALTREQDPNVKAALTLAVAAARLASPDQNQQLAAITTLADQPSPDTRALLSRLASDQAASAALRQAAQTALDKVETRLRWNGVVANIFQGISLGSVLLLAAVGLAVTFGLMGVINMAHGEMIMLGAYAAYVAQEIFRAVAPGFVDFYPIVALPLAFLVAGAVGVLLERTVIRFLYKRPLDTMLATWGISLILQQLVRTIFGAPNKEVANPSWMTGGFEAMAGFFVTWNRIYIIIFCFAVLGAIAALFRFTHFGLETRAVMQNRPMANVMGIPTARIDALTFGLGSGIAGMAGVALSQLGNVSPNLGQIYIIDSFLVVVFGGVGNLTGTLVGAMTLGVVNKILEPIAGAVLGKVVVLVAIILFIQKRPRGLFALKGRAADA